MSTKTSLKGVSIKYGLIHGLIAIVISVLADFAGLTDSTALSFLSPAIAILLIVLAHNEFKKDGDGYMSYGEGLGIGSLLGLISGIISSIFMYIYVSFINTSYLEELQDAQRIAMEEEGMTDSQIEQAMNFSESIMGPTALLIFGILGGVLICFLISLIISAFTKRNRPEFE